MATPTSISSIFYDSLLAGPIERLRRDRQPDIQKKKPKPVTDEQLLAIVDQLEGQIKRLRAELEAARVAGENDVKRLDRRIDGERRYVDDNFKLRLRAPVKKDVLLPHWKW